MINFLGFEQGFLQIPFLSSLSIFFFFNSKVRLSDPIIILHFRLFLFGSVILFLHQLLGKGFVIFQGGLNIILCTFFFYIWINSNSKYNIQYRFFVSLIKFLMFFLFLEFSVIILGFQSTLNWFFPGYKLYNPFDTQFLFGLSNLSGANSLFLGSQIAGTISLVAILVFYESYRSIKKNNFFWLILSLFLFILTLNGTNFVLLIILILFIFRISKIWVKVTLFSFCILIFYFIINNGVFDRFFQEDPDSWVMKNTGMTNLQYYLYAFLSPVIFFIQSNISVKLFGLGANQYSTLGKDLVFESDFGFFVSVILKNGLIWTFGFLFYFYKLFSLAGSSDYFNIRFVLKLSILMLLFSTFHYPQIFVNFSVTIFFSYILALYLVCLKGSEKVNIPKI